MNASAPAGDTGWSAMKPSKALALIGVKEAEWWPTVRATPEGAHRLTEAIVTMAYHVLEEERREGSDIPPLTVKQVDPETGELVDLLNLAYEAVLRERALTYLQSLKLEADAASLEILADVFERQLYLHHPDQWQSLREFVRGLTVDKSDSYQAIIGGFVETVLPALQVNKLATVPEMMGLITDGRLSNLYHLKSEMTQAAQDNDTEALAELLDAAKTMTRSEIDEKYKVGKTRIPPAQAVLMHTNPGWELVITMTDAQKAVILNRLGRRIKYD
jgi:hypothetical protein